MKITIEGKPKEIAALEQALKDGKAGETIISNQIDWAPRDPHKIQSAAAASLGPLSEQK